jgi:hypothetical protein
MKVLAGVDAMILLRKAVIVIMISEVEEENNK